MAGSPSQAGYGLKARRLEVNLLLDENMDERIWALLPVHEVSHVRLRGWDSMKNGALLAATEAHGFQVLIGTHSHNRACLPAVAIAEAGRPSWTAGDD